MAKFKPYAALRLSGMFVKQCIVAAPTFQGALVVYERPAMPEIGNLGLGVCVLPWHDDNLPGGQWEDIVVDENTTLQAGLSRIKKSMLTHGAVAEAVRLIGELSPFTKKELELMAEKLKSKGAPKADAAEKPAKVAKTKPVGGGGKAAGKEAGEPAKAKGNPEALKKAREASDGKRAEAKLKKIKALKKPKDIEAREGSFRHQMLTDLLGAKTVGDFYDMNADGKYDAGCLRFATEAGYVTVG